jgi:hypothetical protein
MSSKETLCFEATMYIDGVKSGEAYNEGHGGMTFIRGVTSASNQALEDARVWCASLPPTEAFGIKMPMDLELFVDLLAGLKVSEKELKSMLKSKIVLKKPDGETYTTKTKRGIALTTATIERFQKDNPTFKVLNLMPFDEALRLYACDYEPLMAV